MGLATCRAPRPMPTEKAVARIPSTSSTAADRTTGWCRSNCFTRPDLRPTRMTFIRAYSSNAVVMLKTGGSRITASSLSYRECPGAVGVDYAENLLKTRISARFSEVNWAPKLLVQCKNLRVSASYWQEVASGFHYLMYALQSAL